MRRLADRFLLHAAAALLAGGLFPPPSPAQSPPAETPDAADALGGRALPADAVEQMKQIIGAAEAEMRQDPADPVKVARYGLALTRGGRVDEGLATLTRAVGMSPEDPLVLLMQAKGLLKASRNVEAASAIQRVIRSPLATPKIAAEANFVGGSLKWREGNLTEAEAMLREAVRLDPENGGALLNLGLLLFNRMDKSEALNYLRLAADRDPDNPRVFSTLARVMEARGDNAQAVVYWERVVAVSPGDAESRFILANHYVAVGALEKAVAQLTEATKISPGNGLMRRLYGEALYRLKRYDEARKQAQMGEKLGVYTGDLLEAINLAEGR